jgi:glycosyltransferase involved in cell wall biosynthesis
MTVGVLKILRYVFKSDADIVHFHDPELIPVGLALKLLGFRVVYDVHEDYLNASLAKHYVPRQIRHIIGKLIRLFERVADVCLDGIVAATPKIGSLMKNRRTVVVQNFPIIKGTASCEDRIRPLKDKRVCYVGSISETRGILEILEATRLINNRMRVDLVLVGRVSPISLLEKMQSHPGWLFTRFLGEQPPSVVPEILREASVGVVCLHPTRAYLDSWPVKMFEYMHAGIPVIASDFPLWRQIVEASGCGLLVNPLNPDEIAEAVEWVFNNPKRAQEMGERGRNAVISQYNWDAEFKKLVCLYEDLLGNTNHKTKTQRTF